MLSTQQSQQQKPQQTQDAPCLTSTTAPGKIFTSRAELQEHYKSDWHRYNLKRREAGLPLLNESDFTARLEAALALRNERQPHEEKNGTSHLKSDKEHKKKKKTKEQRGGGGVVAISQATAYDRMKNPTIETTTPTSNMEVESTTSKANHDNAVVEDAENDDNNTPSSEPEALPEIDPCQSLFDSFISESVQANVTRMHQLYGFFIPDQEYLVDLEGLLGYAQEKIKLGHTCLYCQKLFSTWQGCQRHMVSVSHTKLKYERGIDLDEWDPFYDFTSANEEFFQTATVNKQTKTKEAATMVDADDKMEDDGEEWEDVSEDGDVDDEDKEQAGDAMEEDKDINDNDEDDEDMYAGYQDEIAKYGFDVTPLGELILPDGRIIGHRGLARYYKQRLNPLSRTSANPSAVSAARLAAGERIIRGRVLQLYGDVTPNNHQNHPLALTTTSAGGLVSSSHFKTSIGRAGQGILVPNKAGGNYTALSLYRYRAVVRKQRRDDDKGRRLFNKTYQNINRMDKKANNKMNGVSVAHALR